MYYRADSVEKGMLEPEFPKNSGMVAWPFCVMPSRLSTVRKARTGL